MYILVRDNHLSYLQPGYNHYELVQCSRFDISQVKLKLVKAGYSVVCIDPDDTAGLHPVYWADLNRLHERR